MQIAYGQTVTGTIAVAAQQDNYTFCGTANDRVYVRAVTTSGSLWAAIQLRSPTGTILCSAGGGFGATIGALTPAGSSCLLPATGVYTLRVFDGFNGTLTGGYVLHVQRLNLPTAVPTAFGRLTQGAVGIGGTGAVRFTGQAGDTLAIRMAKVGGVMATVALARADGTIVCSATGSFLVEIGATTPGGPGTCILPAAGTYTVILSDSGAFSQPFSYSIQVHRLNGPGQTVPLPPGPPLNGLLLTAEMDLYTFAAPAGTAITVTMIGSTSQFGLRLHSPSGALVATGTTTVTGGTSVSTLTYGAAVGGTYSAGVLDTANGTIGGTYSVQLGCVGGPCTPTASGFSLVAQTSGGGAGNVALGVSGIPSTATHVLILFSATPAPGGPGTGSVFGLVPDQTWFAFLSSPATNFGLTHFPATANPYVGGPVIVPTGTLSFLAGQTWEGIAVAYATTTGLVDQTGVSTIAW